MAIASPQNNYATFRAVDFERSLPLVASAQNRNTLPSGQINAIRVLEDGAVCVATTSGLAISSDKGQSWNWQRGADWADKVRGFLGGAPANWKENGVAALPEDYIANKVFVATGMRHPRRP